MNRARRLGISSIVIAVLAAGACGSTAKTRSGATATPVTLHLASGEAASTSPRDAGAAIYPVRPTKYVLAGKLANLGARAVVWRMNPHSVNAAEVRRFAAVLGLVGTPTKTPDGWEVQGTSATLSFFVSGGDVTVSYSLGAPNAVGGSTGSAGSAGSGGVAAPPVPVATAPIEVPPPVRPVLPVPPVDVPSADDATAIARTLLDHLGVLAGHEWSTVVSDSGGVASSCAVGLPCPTVPPEILARTVTLSLTLAGTRVNGMDWSVTIGEHRRVESLNGEWASPAAIVRYALRSTTRVFADLQHGTARFGGPQPMVGFVAPEAPAIGSSSSIGTVAPVTIDVTGVSLGLERWDASENGRPVVDLVPTYRFHARDGGSTHDIEVLALEPGAVTFTNPVPAPQPLGAPTPAP